jgi:hypothetical protein
MQTQYVSGSVSCVQCLANSYCPQYSTASIRCDTGKVSDAMSYEYTHCRCEPNRWILITVAPNFTCPLCTANNHCDGTNMQTCPTNSFSSAGSSGSSSCYPNAGYYKDEHSEMVACRTDQDYYCAADTNNGFNFCPTGTRSIPTLVTRTNTYRDCGCPAGKRTSYGALDTITCSNCPPGWYCLLGDVYGTQCDSGKDSPENSGMPTDCTCASGTYPLHTPGTF